MPAARLLPSQFRDPGFDEPLPRAIGGGFGTPVKPERRRRKRTLGHRASSGPRPGRFPGRAAPTISRTATRGAPGVRRRPRLRITP